MVLTTCSSRSWITPLANPYTRVDWTEKLPESSMDAVTNVSDSITLG
jgi:hypothetical protein